MKLHMVTLAPLLAVVLLAVRSVAGAPAVKEQEEPADPVIEEPIRPLFPDDSKPVAAPAARCGQLGALTVPLAFLTILAARLGGRFTVKCAVVPLSAPCETGPCDSPKSHSECKDPLKK